MSLRVSGQTPHIPVPKLPTVPAYSTEGNTEIRSVCSLSKVLRHVSSLQNPSQLNALVSDFQNPTPHSMLRLAQIFRWRLKLTPLEKVEEGGRRNEKDQLNNKGEERGKSILFSASKTSSNQATSSNMKMNQKSHVVIIPRVFWKAEHITLICMTAQMADVLVLSLMQKSSLGHWSLSLVCQFGKLVWGLVFACKKRGMRSKLINKIKKHLSTAFVFNFTLHPYARALHFHFRRTREVVTAFH